MILRMIILAIQMKCLKNRFETEFQNSNELIFIDSFFQIIYFKLTFGYFEHV